MTTFERAIDREKAARLAVGKSDVLTSQELRILANSARYRDAVDYGELHFRYTTETGIDVTTPVGELSSTTLEAHPYPKQIPCA